MQCNKEALPLIERLNKEHPQSKTIRVTHLNDKVLYGASEEDQSCLFKRQMSS